MSGSPDLSTIVLCYRSGESIRRVIEPLHRLLEESCIRYELVLVANYWADRPDDTLEVVRCFAEDHDHVLVQAEEKRGAMGWDMRRGLAAATGACLVVIDGAAQNPVADVMRMYDLMCETGADVGKGRRINRADGLCRRVLSCGYNLVFQVLFPSRGIWDMNGKPKAITRDAYERMHLESNDWFVDAEIVLAARRADMTIVELPVVFLENTERSSFVRLPAIWEFVAHLIRYRVLGRP